MSTEDQKNIQPIIEKSNTSLDEQKFLICEYCGTFSAISKEIPTCEHCTSAIVNNTLKFVNVTRPNVTRICNGCNNVLYITQLYQCNGCRQTRFCFSCYTGTVRCKVCNTLRLSLHGNNIWSPVSKKQT